MARVTHVVAKELVVAAVWTTLGWAAGRLRPLDAALGVVLPAWVRGPGVVAVVAGAAGVLGCGAILGDRGIGNLRGDEWFLPTEFVTWGPFRFVRNPMSLAAVILSVGIALWRRSGVALGLAGVALAGFHAVIVCVEEPGLEKRFGGSYRAYKAHVPRWVPRLRPWDGAA